MSDSDHSYSPRFAEFFAGIGLMRLGLESASGGWSCAFANDLDPVKQKIYRGQFGDELDGSDVHVLPSSGIPDIELATASFPCTDLSLAGARRGIRSGESSAFWGFHRVLDEMGARRPPVVLLENVVGLVSSHGGADFRDVLIAMNELGYTVDPFVLDAKWFVPQSRQRLFVVCLQRRVVQASADALCFESRLRPRKLVDFIAENSAAIDWAIRELPDPPVQCSRSLTDIIEDPPSSHADWWSEDRVEYLYNQMFARHQSWVDEHRTKRRYSYATAFRRVRPMDDGTKRSMAELRTDGFAGCLRTPKGGSGRQILVRSGYGRMRARLLSGSECARLMGADGFRLDGVTENQALFGFGDAVCVDAIRWIAEQYLNPVLSSLACKEYASASDDRSAVPTPAAS